MAPIKKVGIMVYVPAGDICEGATFKCPLLLDMGNTPSCFCVLIPDSFWWNHERKTKNSKCPSLYHAVGNKLSENDMRNHRLRLVQQSIKNQTFNNFTSDRFDTNEE
jgi:hypothetical protein